MAFNILPIDIQEVDFTDLPKLQKLSIETFNDSFRHFAASRNFSSYTSQNYNYGQLVKEMLNPQSYFYFIFYNHKLAGYLKLNIDSAQSRNMGPDTLEIDRIYLRQGFEYIGLEKRLLDFTIKQAQKFNKNSIWSSVWEHDDSIIHFYKEFGFKAIDSADFELNGLIQKDLVMETSIN